jgi:pSer/pThr/pTyr-binding forkhead associated (FHA) protein
MTMNRLVARIELDSSISLSIYESNLPLLIGRDSSCEICVPQARVSRQHCELFLESNVLCLKDTSTNGTMVGNRRLIGESTSIQDRTDILLTNEVTIAITPYAVSECSGDRRVTPDRRQDDRRKQERRTADVSVVNFERRGDGTRRRAQRRVSTRRSIGASGT